MWLSFAGAALQGWWAWRWERTSPERELDRGAAVSSHPTCTVVVCMHNEELRVVRWARHLAPALDRAEREGRHVSVVAVNHGSTDGTGALLSQCAQADSRWSVIDVPRTRSSKKEALVAGIQKTTSEVLVVTDADCTPLADSWLLHMTSGAGSMWDVHVGLSLPASKGSVLARLQRLEARRLAQKAVGAVEAGKSYLAFGRNMAFTRSMWDRVGGMKEHEHLASGDDDLWLQSAVLRGARVRANVHPDAQTTSEWPSSWMAWRRQKTRHFTASPAYPWGLRFRLALPGLGWLLLLSGVVHNPSGTSTGLLALALMVRTLTFGMFLHRAGQPWREAWELVMEPMVSAFRLWAWWKGSTSESTSWK